MSPITFAIILGVISGAYCATMRFTPTQTAIFSICLGIVYGAVIAPALVSMGLLSWGP